MIKYIVSFFLCVQILVSNAQNQNEQVHNLVLELNRSVNVLIVYKSNLKTGNPTHFEWLKRNGNTPVPEIMRISVKMYAKNKKIALHDAYLVGFSTPFGPTTTRWIHKGKIASRINVCCFLKEWRKLFPAQVNQGDGLGFKEQIENFTMKINKAVNSSANKQPKTKK